MFIVTCLYKKVPIELNGIRLDLDLSNADRIGFFPVFETKEAAKRFADQISDKNVNIIEIDENGNVR